MSLGGPSYSESSNEIWQYAYDNGILVLASSGNSNTHLGVDGDKYPCMYDLFLH